MANNEEINVVKAGVEHSTELLRLLRESFCTREPLCVALEMKWGEDFCGLASNIDKLINEGYSFVAINPVGRVVGCRLSTILEIDRDKVPEPEYMQLQSDTPRKLILVSIFNTLMKGWTKELLDCHVVFEFMMMCVEEKYGGKGIAQKLVNRSLKLAEELQVDYVYTIATNWLSQKVFDKLNFTVIRTKNYDEFKDDAGNPLLQMKEGSTCLKWMVKKIKQ